MVGRGWILPREGSFLVQAADQMKCEQRAHLRSVLSRVW